jgi:aminoglycoside phosphotransferase (APT) family kinase protein
MRPILPGRPREDACVDPADDPGLLAVLRALDVPPASELGRGGEARVFALGDDRVVRILHPAGRADDIARRQRLVDELVRTQPAFALPRVLEIGELDGRVYAIERRLRGHSLLDELRTASGAARQQLIEAYLDTSAALGDLALDRRPHFGDLVADEPVTAPAWREYLEQKAASSLRRATPSLRAIDAAALAEPFTEPAGASFVHLDAFAGNMLTDGARITAVLDVGASSVAGDRRFDPLASATYLMSEQITPTASAADHDIALSWLRSVGLIEWLEPARRWLAAYWSFARDDHPLVAWCESVLG